MSAITDKPAGVFRAPKGGEYVVSCDKLELPRGAYFVALPATKVEPGDMLLFDLAGFLIPGRWRPNFHGSDWIDIPGYLIEITGKIPVRIVGKVVPAEIEVRQVTNLLEREYGHLFENPFPRTLDG
jgi:hypothetical protein